MGKTSSQIVSDIENYASTKCSGKNYSDYYVGITNDPEKRLFTDHNVLRDACWIYIDAESNDIARSAEKTLLDKGMKGGEGGGDESSLFVYCYQITTSTKE